MTSLSPAKELCDLEVRASGEMQTSYLSLDAEDVKERMVTGGAGLSLQPHQLQSRSNRDQREFVSLPPSFRPQDGARRSRSALPDSAPAPPAANLTAAVDIELGDRDMFYDGGPPSSSAAFTPPEDGAAASPSRRFLSPGASQYSETGIASYKYQ